LRQNAVLGSVIAIISVGGFTTRFVVAQSLNNSAHQWEQERRQHSLNLFDPVSAMSVMDAIDGATYPHEPYTLMDSARPGMFL
jgi:hypothetical protein